MEDVRINDERYVSEGYVEEKVLVRGEVCPVCGAYDSLVPNTRYKKMRGRYVRTRKCNQCGNKWQTIEVSLKEEW